jgi:hypothetical protein
MIGQAIAEVDGKDGSIKAEKIKARQEGEFPIVVPEELQYIDVASKSNCRSISFINTVFRER